MKSVKYGAIVLVLLSAACSQPGIPTVVPIIQDHLPAGYVSASLEGSIELPAAPDSDQTTIQTFLSPSKQCTILRYANGFSADDHPATDDEQGSRKLVADLASELGFEATEIDASGALNVNGLPSSAVVAQISGPSGSGQMVGRMSNESSAAVVVAMWCKAEFEHQDWEEYLGGVNIVDFKAANW